MCLEIWVDYVEFLMLLTSLDRSGNSDRGSWRRMRREGVNAKEREGEELGEKGENKKAGR